jgi:hypothetical protein
MDTIKALGWAMSLRGVDPDAKLLAVYIAGRMGGDGRVILDLEQAAEWCGFVSPARRETRPNRARVALQQLDDLSVDDWGQDIITVTLGDGK